MLTFPFFRKIMYSDLQTIAPEQYMKQITKRITELHAVSVRLMSQKIRFVINGIECDFESFTACAGCEGIY